MTGLVYPMRKRVEVAVALYGIGFGLYILTLLALGKDPLAWAGMVGIEASIYGYLVLAAGVIHAAGTWINGSWRWSPALRVLGMTQHAMAVGVLCYEGISSGSSAGFAYGALLLLLVGVIYSEIEDLRFALQVGKRWMK